MAANRNAPTVWEGSRIPVQAKLAALWASVMFVYVYVDVLGFYKPGVVDDIMAGTVGPFAISQTWAVGALVLMVVPSLMVFASLALPARANRLTNIVVASLYALVSVGNAVGESWLLYFSLAAAVEVVVLALVIRYAWTWPRTTTPAISPGAEVGRTPQRVAR